MEFSIVPPERLQSKAEARRRTSFRQSSVIRKVSQIDVKVDIMKLIANYKIRTAVAATNLERHPRVYGVQTWWRLMLFGSDPRSRRFVLKFTTLEVILFQTS
jgi:hypothetical protein